MSAMEVDEVPTILNEADPDVDEGDSIPDDEYEIEAILSHEVGHFPEKSKKNDIAYLVSWKGYGIEHNSWVEEQDAENASEMIEAYWNTASKDGVARKGDGTGWTGAKSNKTRRAIKKEPLDDAIMSASTSTARGRRTGRTIAQEEQLARKRMKTASQASYTRAGIDMTDVSGIEEEVEVTQKQLKRLTPEEQVRAQRRIDSRRYLSMPDWEQVIKYVETVEINSSGKLIAYVIFENSERHAFEAAVVNHRCPQKIITFYESKLRFKTTAADLPPLTTLPSSSLQRSTRGDGGEAIVTDEKKGKEHQGEQTVLEDVMAESREIAAILDESSGPAATLEESSEPAVILNEANATEDAVIVISSDVVESSKREERQLESTQ